MYDGVVIVKGLDHEKLLLDDALGERIKPRLLSNRGPGATLGANPSVTVRH